jgi:hypothetical protein
MFVNTGSLRLLTSAVTMADLGFVSDFDLGFPFTIRYLRSTGLDGLQ